MLSTFTSTSACAASALLIISMATHHVRAATVLEGCYSSSQPLSSQGTATYQSSAYCSGVCTKLNAAVLGLSDGNTCWCGNELPPADSKVSDSKCNTPCQGYPDEDCGGGTNYYTVWLTGTEDSVPNYGGGNGGDSSSALASTSTRGVTSSTSLTTFSTTTAPTTSVVTPNPGKPSVITKPGQTIIITSSVSGARESATASSTALSQTKSGSSTNIGGIAAGVVVGVFAVAALAAGLFFWLRHRRRRTAEQEYNRSQGERKPPATGYSTTSDSRLDPEAGNRRNSLGSIADDQDFSRKILKVANPT